jgi:hypothetical protein
MSITLLWTLLNQGFEGTGNLSAVKKAMVVCPTSLVGQSVASPRQLTHLLRELGKRIEAMGRRELSDICCPL